MLLSDLSWHDLSDTCKKAEVRISDSPGYHYLHAGILHIYWHHARDRQVWDLVLYPANYDGYSRSRKTWELSDEFMVQCVLIELTKHMEPADAAQ